ncbi:FAD binding domain-containing protein [Chaetomium fimeti]|uniref:FAD binding domain-containing protein n=1 Tax=Chaetomium fimeti TaxID=1854472 RepID=A0AAE0HIK2_9PEZI|nr:FAD binding domain-containing protein [Chaetomium fimeti]
MVKFSPPLLGMFMVAATFYDAIVATTCGPSPDLNCCGMLVASGLGDKVLLPNQTEYTSRLGSYWSVSAALSPWCMVLPYTAEDVSSIIKTLVSGNCSFGVKGGGHGSFALSNAVEDGVTIDFANMNGTTYNAETEVASILPGGSWQEVYETLAPHGVTVTGGRAGTVGIGGFLTGGGNSFHAASHGMACDTVVNFEVVIADGSIINANAEQNPDLWIALKGGSANLGLVTRFDLRVIKFPDAAKPDIWGKFLSFDLADGDNAIDAMVNFTEHAHLDQNTSSIMFFGHIPAAGGMVLHLGLENTKGIVDPPAVAGYLNAGKILSTNSLVVPMADLVRSENPAQAAGVRNIWFTLTFKADARVMKYAASRHTAAVAKLSASLSPDSNFTTMCAFQPLSHAIAQHGVRNGGNVMGLDYWMQNGDSGILLLLELGVRGAENEAKAYPVMREWAREVEAYARELGVAWEWRYLNYAGREQDPLASIGPVALGRLRAAARKYDPDGVFQTLRGSGFKIPKGECD